MSAPFVSIDRDAPLLLPTGLLIHCYATGTFASRCTETLTFEPGKENAEGGSCFQSL